MKNYFLSLIIFISCFLSLEAQATYTINEETLQLDMLVEGELDLLSYHINDSYRFFIKDKNDVIQELLNTKNPDGAYSREYLTILNALTEGSNMDTTEVSFGRYSLKQFIKAYNSNDSGRFAYTDERVRANTRLGFYGGMTNHPFIQNTKDAKTPFFGAELEFYRDNSESRHAGFFNIEHALNTNNINYTSTQLGLGYRYRFIYKSGFNIYGNLKFATYTFSKQTFEMGLVITEDVTYSTFRVPFIFGLGSDIKISEHHFITLSYNEIASIFIDNNGNFPIDFAVGYKFKL